MLLDQQREFLECHLYSELLTDAEIEPFSASASKMVDPNSNISGSRESKAAAKFFTEDGAGFSANKKASV